MITLCPRSRSLPRIMLSIRCCCLGPGTADGHGPRCRGAPLPSSSALPRLACVLVVLSSQSSVTSPAHWQEECTPTGLQGAPGQVCVTGLAHGSSA